MKTILKITHPILSFITAVIIISSIFFGVSGGLYAAAAETESFTDELSRITIDGKAFDEADFPAVADGQAEVLYFHELGYSYYGNAQSDYELIVYIYNPNQSSVIADIRNTIQMKTGSAARYEKYTLSLERSSTDNRFFKFSVKLSEAEKTEVLSSLDSSARRYEISSIELMYSGFNATDIAIEQTYIFSGYEEGHGQTDDTELSATLNYTIEGGAETVPLEVKHTTWRPEGTNGNSNYTQDSLHSVYFAIPNEIDSKYDYLNSVHCRWLEAYLAPMIATDSTELIEAMRNLLIYNTGALSGEIIVGGKPNAPTEFDFSQFNYVLLSDLEVYDAWSHSYLPAYAFGKSADDFAKEKVIERIFLTLQTDDNGIVTSDKLLSAIQNEANYGYFSNNKAVAAKYPSYLFESYDTQFTDTVIEVGKGYTLNSEEIKANWWERFWGINHVENKQTFEDIQAIQEVEALTGNKATDCANYYISENDYSEFYEFYQQNKNTATIYLLRFATSEYKSMQFEVDKHLGAGVFKKVETNTYIAQESVYLDFDIIDLEYIKEDVSYVLPVSMSPIDIIPELTPPPDMYDESFFWYGVGIIAGLVAFYVVYRFIIDKTDKAKEREVIDNLYRGGKS